MKWKQVALKTINFLVYLKWYLKNILRKRVLLSLQPRSPVRPILRGNTEADSIFSVLQPGIGLYYECIRFFRAKLNLYDVLSFYQVLQNGYM